MIPINWQDLENQVEQLLIDNNIVYRKEGQISSRGHEAGKGQSDFTILNRKIGFIECKHVEKLTRLNYPRPKMAASGFMIKPHQLKACRSNNGGFLIYDEESQSYYWLTPNDLDKIIIENGLVASLKGHISHLETDLDTLTQLLTEKD